MKEIPEIIPVPDGQRWSCLQCVRHDRDTSAVVLIFDESGPTGMCGNHAEVMDLEDLEDAVQWFYEEVGL